MDMYKSKRDGFFIKIIVGSIILIGAVLLIPYSIRVGTGVEVTLLETVLIFSFLPISILLILWPFWGICYEFHDHYLLVKGGLFRSEILYENITKVTATYFSVGNSLGGYRVMTSRDGVEINYTTGMMGHVRISPEQKVQFL